MLRHTGIFVSIHFVYGALPRGSRQVSSPPSFGNSRLIEKPMFRDVINAPCYYEKEREKVGQISEKESLKKLFCTALKDVFA